MDGFIKIFREMECSYTVLLKFTNQDILKLLKRRRIRSKRKKEEIEFSQLQINP